MQQIMMYHLKTIYTCRWVKSSGVLLDQIYKALLTILKKSINERISSTVTYCQRFRVCHLKLGFMYARQINVCSIFGHTQGSQSADLRQ